jgi:hypothetical protein
VFWVILAYFNIRNTLPKSGTFLLQRVKQLLGNGLERNNETTFAAKQPILNNEIYAAIAEYRLRRQIYSHGND